jgi:hypothetical protein
VYRKHKDEAGFFLVYIREAHPEDVAKLLDRQGCPTVEPTNPEERAQPADACAARLTVEMPILMDTLDNRVEKDYTAWPYRLYIVGVDGRVAYKGVPGPCGFNVPEMTAVLEMLLRRPAGPVAAREASPLTLPPPPRHHGPGPLPLSASRL